MDRWEAAYRLLTLYLLWQQNRILQRTGTSVPVAVSESGAVSLRQRMRWGIRRYWPLVVMGGLTVAVWWSPRKIEMHTPATPCDMRIGENEHAKLIKVLRQLREQLKGSRSGLEAHVVVDRGKEESCLYAKDLHRVFEEADWTTHIITASAELIGKGVWLYGFEHDAEALELCSVLKEQIDPEITCCRNKAGAWYTNAWDLFVRSAPGGVTTNE